MPRKGVSKARTGCLTCKYVMARKVKCDEGRPGCMRCQSAGKKCQGYQPPPVGYFTWDELLSTTRPRPALAAVPEASSLELRGMSFYRHVVAPSVGGPVKSTFWTKTVAEVLHREPAARHAIQAISALYEHSSLGLSDGPTVPYEDGRRAVTHYNAAIRHLVSPAGPSSKDTVMLVCILFIYIEFMRGDNESATTHIRHGITLLNSCAVRDDIARAFLHLSIFPYFFSDGVTDFPLPREVLCGPCPASFDLSDAHVWLDPLLLRTVRLTRMANQHRYGMPELQSLEKVVQAISALDADLDAWWSAFVPLQHQWREDDQHRTTLLLLEARWLHAKMRVATQLDVSEAVWDFQLDRFRRVVDIARQARAAEKLRDWASRKFAFVMGFCPLLFWVAHKCRFLRLRVSALALFETLCWAREAAWDRAMLHGLAKTIIEVEHGIELTPDKVRELSADVGRHNDDDLALPADGRRVGLAFMRGDVELSTAQDGRLIGRRKVCLYLHSATGAVEPRECWMELG
ncbi:hypothetical protein JDV02_009978 [Purpureocillium takamizusanense]|uniref:Zn(2)-C6 fungal-type domain-containing protein n=1 Tax=Purpureocillium takamizusanense TaxID=2060973 RepID=A0A9Q8VGY1_9HYPO|nr:uncharacterized protein JDV02_009978 [Purpureocillium takamizusanense]UNI24212.1 hypothetical protein JDV02_009978 [Purpureocillium takamizusanense]